MRKTMSLLMVGALALGVAGAAFAKGAEKVMGSLSKIDASARTFTVDAAGHPMDFTLAPGGVVMEDGKATSLGVLRSGEKVTVSYHDEGARHVASRIAAGAKPMAKPAAAKPSAK